MGYSPTPPATLALVNCVAVTMDQRNSFVTAIAITEDRIVATDEPEVSRSITDRTVVIDLGGRTVIPGIIDAHNHLMAGGLMLNNVMLFDVPSIRAVQALLRERVSELPPGAWLEGGGWIECQFEENRLPTRLDLDEACPEHPVCLDRLFGMAVVNTRALELAGIHRDTPDPVRGSIDRDTAGVPTGILRDGAQGLVRRVMPPRRLDDLTEAIQRAAEEYLRWGITSVIDPGVTPQAAKAYQKAREAAALPLRVTMMPAWHGLLREGGELDSRLAHLGVYEGFGDRWLRFGPVKMAIDGGLGSRTALLSWPLLDGSRSQVPLRLDLDRLEEYFAAAQEQGWSAGIHCCGDVAQDRAVAALAATAPFGRGRWRHSIIHGYFPSRRALDTMARLDVAVSLQPGFIHVEGDLYFDIAPEEKLQRFKPLRTYLKAGVRVAAGSDMTSAHYNPFLGMHAAVTRRTARGRSLGEAECVSRLEMLRLFTANGAWLSGEDGHKGVIGPGYLADLAVLSDDILTIPDARIKELEVVLTVVGGRVAHSTLT